MDKDEEIRVLRTVLQAWEPRVICPQCGQRYTLPACGFAHAAIYTMLNEPQSGKGSHA